MSAIDVGARRVMRASVPRISRSAANALQIVAIHSGILHSQRLQEPLLEKYVKRFSRNPLENEAQ